MRLMICSEKNAIQLAKTIREPVSIISITCPEDKNVKFPNNPCIVNVFRMQFNDVVTKVGNHAPPQRKDFIGLKEFVDNLDCEILLVHCGAGVSRSAAVATAINEYLDLGYDILNDSMFSPNPLVYKYAREELGLPSKDAAYFNDIFNKAQIDTI